MLVQPTSTEEESDMDLPKRKNAPKLPRKPRGGGAAARQQQFDQERGLEDACPQGDADAGGQAAEPEKTKHCEEKER
jgi:hypothetical protein